MGIKITAYEAVCNLGRNIDEIFSHAVNGDNSYFVTDRELIKGYNLRLGKIDIQLEQINNPVFDTRCNRLAACVLKLLTPQVTELLQKYSKEDIAVIVATTNGSVEEFEKSGLKVHSELGNPAEFVKELLGLNNVAITVSTACSSGAKAFSAAKNYLQSGVSKAVLIIGADSLTKLPLYGFSSLEILSPQPANPFSKNYTGINIGEACACFIVEDTEKAGIEIMGIGETSDVFHSTTPDPEAKEVKKAIEQALSMANIGPEDVDYINLHGTGTLANDTMEAEAVNAIFTDNIPVSSTKPLTGHCLGAAASIEAALCCHLLNNFSGKLFPHVYDSVYNQDLKPVKLVKPEDKYSKCNICVSNSFGFGGTNAIIVLGKNNG